MRKFQIYSLIVFATFFISRSLCAQTSYYEFLSEDDIHSKAELGLELWNIYLRSDMDSVKVVAIELLMDASEKEDEFARAVGTRILGTHLFRSGKIDKGIEYMISSREYFERNEDYITSSEIYNEVGHALFLKGQFDEAIVSFQKSIQFGKKSTDPTAEFSGEMGMGRCYISRGDTSIGLGIINNYRRLSLKHGKYEAVADALAKLAQVADDGGNVTLANQYYFRSLSYSKKSKSKIHISHSYANMGILKFNNSDFDSSLYYFNASLKLRKELNNPKGIIEGYYNLGFFYASLEKYDLALENLVTSRELASKNGFLYDEIDAITDMIDVYSSINDSTKMNVLIGEKLILEKQLKNQKGLDDEIINSIDLNFKVKSDKTKGEVNKGVGWKELTIGILILALTVFFWTERKRIN
ncbi:MAG: tetratricopeptide (TPR) repeat protein [Salibacteraceae bacterium]|jgi:tetratricopeptide (TPR) repeat protein